MKGFKKLEMKPILQTSLDLVKREFVNAGWLIEDALFNLKDDRMEKTNLSSKMPEAETSREPGSPRKP